MLTLQFVPYHTLENLTPGKRIRRLLNIVKENKIVLLEGRLKKEEETDLIKQTMGEIDKKFKGIELAVIYPKEQGNNFLEKLRKIFANLLLGNRQGLTIVGPASIVKEIKQDPNKIILFTKEAKLRRK